MARAAALVIERNEDGSGTGGGMGKGSGLGCGGNSGGCGKGGGGGSSDRFGGRAAYDKRFGSSAGGFEGGSGYRIDVDGGFGTGQGDGSWDKSDGRGGDGGGEFGCPKIPRAEVESLHLRTSIPLAVVSNTDVACLEIMV